MVAGLVAAHSVLAIGQVQSPPAQSCAEVLTAPTRDSVLLQVMLTVHAFDRERDLPSSIQFDFGEAVRQHLVIPQPLGVDAYETWGDSGKARRARLTLRGNYAATLTAEGRVVDVSMTGGARNTDFDSAVLLAMRAIDSADHLSPADVGLPKEDIRIRVEIAARDTAVKPGIVPLDRVVVTSISVVRPDPFPKLGTPPPLAPMPPDSAMAVPMFRFRVPVRAVTSPTRQIPGFGNLRYPDSQRRRGASGQAELSFIIDAEGQVEPESVQVVDATQRDFAKAVLDGMPQFRFRPLEVDGCRVRVYVEQPFQFFVSK